ncbi:haloacid dehalogenase [Arthrobacter sp. ERGS1:01]|uniref:HAD-IIA family hydrolase n=1 Tax=Arthrobacter sp. ERGS1:01 TaxID=1704044 RepID=UPI0006B66ED5|nr:HAD-IIA family hydrolase [Arthrobacter sp. ERGS1:01]ALE05402.1 haloacid dehalogenase [Arthrobacter sp. ERGS1:01]
MTGETMLSGFDAILADLDGVVYAGPHAIDGAIDALVRLADHGVALGYVTNNASRTPAHVAAHLRELGAPAEDDQVVSSAQAGAALLADKFPAGSKVLVIGSKALVREIELVGMKSVDSAHDDPDVVIQGFDPHLGWANLAEATYAINAGATWIATNTDMTIPRDRGIAPGNGTLVAAVRAAVGHDPLVAGKPEAPLFHTAAKRLGATAPLVVGDRLDTDILGGNNAGMATALVLTGVDSVDTALRARTAERPRFIIENLQGLYQPYPETTRAGGVFTCGGEQAGVDGNTITVTLSGSNDDGSCDLNAGRAMCAAWWAAVPDSDTVTAPRVVFQRAGQLAADSRA